MFQQVLGKQVSRVNQQEIGKGALSLSEFRWFIQNKNQKIYLRHEFSIFYLWHHSPSTWNTNSKLGVTAFLKLSNSLFLFKNIIPKNKVSVFQNTRDFSKMQCFYSLYFSPYAHTPMQHTYTSCRMKQGWILFSALNLELILDLWWN